MLRIRRSHPQPHPAGTRAPWLFVLGLFTTGLVSGVLITLILREVWPAQVPRDEARYRELRDFVAHQFVGEVDAERLADDALRGLVDGLDPYSRFYAADEVATVERETHGRYRGIGAVFKEPLEEGVVLFAMAGSPAERAGLSVGDRIVSIDGQAVDELGRDGLMAALGGETRDALELLVRSRSGDERELAIGPDVLIDPSVRHTHMADPERGIGYLAVRSFSEATAGEFDAAIEELEELGLRALIVDVRGNYGGLLQAAADLANRFVAHGVLVATEGRGERVRYEARAATAQWEGLPLVVLVDGESASASEIFAAALQDHRAAVLVGSPTYGKGTVQRVKLLDGGRSLTKVTTSYYYTPAGRNLERTVEKAWEFGILPDVWVQLDEARTRQVHAALDHYSPPADALHELRAWEAEEGLELVPQVARDPQLEAALTLLAGDRSGEIVAADPAAAGVPVQPSEPAREQPARER